jgi:CDGSH-type Zn-finger protein
MARQVRHDATGPFEVPEGTELPVWICGCGLSKNLPYCDGTHKKTRDEGDQLFVYDDQGHRTPIK